MENIRQTFTDASGFLSKAVKDANIHDEASVVFNRAKQVKYFWMINWLMEKIIFQLDKLQNFYAKRM